MAQPIIADRICETSTTTGTGALTLAGAITGYNPFSYIMNVNDVCYYLIEAVDASGLPTGQWETGLGTYSAANTLTRTVVADSSTGAAITFSAGTKRVHLTAPAQLLGRHTVLATKAADLTAQNLTTAAAVTWDTDETSYSAISWHNTGTNPSRMTVSQYERVRLSGQVGFANVTASETITLSIRLNGTTTTVGEIVCTSPSTSPTYQIVAPIIFTGNGNYYELFVKVGADTSVDIVAARSWFQLELIQ